MLDGSFDHSIKISFANPVSKSSDVANTTYINPGNKIERKKTPFIDKKKRRRRKKVIFFLFGLRVVNFKPPPSKKFLFKIRELKSSPLVLEFCLD